MRLNIFSQQMEYRHDVHNLPVTTRFYLQVTGSTRDCFFTNSVFLLVSDKPLCVRTSSNFSRSLQ